MMLITRALLAFTALLLTWLPAHAQIAFGGTPIGLMKHRPWLEPAEELVLPEVDAAALIAEDEARLAAGIKGPWRFGFNHAVDLRSSNSGTWTTLRNGDRVWRMAITCPGAFSINFRFNRYVIPEGGRVFVYNDAGEWLGAFTAASAGGMQSMGVTQISGERITIEYHEPLAVAGQGELAIDRVTHAYRDVFRTLKDFGDSESCNINVICPEGDPWRDQIRSVAIITTGGSGFCTGTLLNNCAQDSTPYFLTANHCLDADVENWVFRFNWDSPSCDPTENGPTNQTVANCVLLTSSTTTDLAFLELSAKPPADYDVFYSGWDKSGATPDSVCGIHHPSGDIKKISLSQSPVGQANIDLGTGAADCWQVTVWDAGTTEPGSSGSGLWNQNKRLIGQLYGGAADCANSVDDYYGRLDVSWPLLETYLGSCGDTLPGLGEVPIPILYDAAITSIVNIPVLICGDSVVTPIVTLKNNGIATLLNVTISYGLMGSPVNVFNWSGSLLPLQTANVQLPGSSLHRAASSYS
ncbi:MAG: trypsin-like peptidase domain-containing protein [Flavobacteriales bacterium]|nr:trypsin-like peptidase domain-containing protein [Flavobacteriales bacterium]